MLDLTTNYLGLKLRNPIVVSACSLCENVDKIIRMEESGAGAVVLHSLFEEQINIESNELDLHLSHGSESFPEALSYFPDMTSYNLGPEGYLDHVRKAKQAVKIPIIGSLNGVSTGGWTKHAKKIEEAGADALELNIYYLPTDPTLSSGDVEKMYVDLVREVKASIKIPVAVKVSYYFTAFANMAQQLDKAGANALVIFNRFYQPDYDLEDLEVKPNLVLSAPYELRLRLHWAAILYGNIGADVAITGGVHSGYDVLKAMMAGARVAMTTSALYKHGIQHIGTMLNDVKVWMEEHEYESIQQMQGSMSHRNVAEPAAFERANYMKVLSSYALKGRI